MKIYRGHTSPPQHVTLFLLLVHYQVRTTLRTPRTLLSDYGCRDIFSSTISSSMEPSSFLYYLFLYGFSIKLQCFAFAISLHDKLVAKKVFPFSLCSRIPESCKSPYDVYSTMPWIVNQILSFADMLHILEDLYILSFVGGYPGLFTSFTMLRHKTSYRKRGFRNRLIFAAVIASVLKIMVKRLSS